MRNKDIILKRLQLIKGKVQWMKSMGSRINLSELHSELEQMKDWIEEAEGYIEQEGLSAEEKNPYINR